MSIDALMSAAPAGAEGDSESLAWLQELLRSAMEGVMAAEGNPIPKANSLARLAGLYLKTCQVTELKRERKQLAARVAELEEALGALEAEWRERPSAGESEAALEVLPSEAGGAGRLVVRASPRSGFANEPPVPSLATASGGGRSPRGAHPPSRAPGIRRR
jgi:hypothetical protein